MSATVHDLCTHHRDEDVVATGEGGARTMGQLLADAHTIAQELLNFPRGGEVAVVCHDRYFFAAALLAAVERELVVALPPNAQPETVKQLRSSGTVFHVITDHDGTPGIDVREVLSRSSGLALGEGAREGGREGSREGGRPLLRPRIPAHRRMVVVYTSGSTGVPMACPKTAGQLLTEAAVLARTFEIEARDAVVATVPPHHIYGLLFSVLMPLRAGASFSRETPFYADAVHHILSRDHAKVLVSVPAHLRALSIMEREGIGSVHRVFSSGAAMPDETRAMLERSFGWKVTEVLGSSETGGIGWRETAGAPFTLFDVVDVAVGEDERMLVSSPYLPLEARRPFPTGDRIELVGPRSFRHLGRQDGVLKIGSTRVSVAELEARLLAIPGVDDAAVLAVETKGGRGHETWAALVRAPGSTLDVDHVRTALRAWLDPVVIPRRYRFVEALPRESTGKLQREALRGLFAEEAS
jgi:4-coumarate--CoA ligase (photoactive yellow protein activation family)